MRGVVKYIVGKTYKPLLVKYLSSTRMYRYRNIVLTIPPQVFHPGFFFSTKLLLKYLNKFGLTDKHFLELGAGSGLISINASQQGAKVVASDINTIAVQALQNNAAANNVQMHILHSDLFAAIPQQAFDIISINPPYYKRKPVTDADYAWYCGEGGEYFQALFKDLGNYIHSSSEVLMILCDGCDLEMIQSIAGRNSFQLNCVYSRNNLLEKNFIYKIAPINA